MHYIIILEISLSVSIYFYISDPRTDPHPPWDAQGVSAETTRPGALGLCCNNIDFTVCHLFITCCDNIDFNMFILYIIFNLYSGFNVSSIVT